MFNWNALENHLGELWSLFHFLMPNLLGSAQFFQHYFRNPIEKHGDEQKQAILSHIVKPFLLRRTKSEVLKELPPKTEMIRKLDFQTKQRDLYEALRISMEKKVRAAIAAKGIKQSQIIS